MTKRLTTAALCAAIVLLAGSAATADLTVKYIFGDKVVYDEANGTYWYPYLTDMVDMTRDQQQHFIDFQLNGAVYANIVDWQLANYEQLCDFCNRLAQARQRRTQVTSDRSIVKANHRQVLSHNDACIGSRIHNTDSHQIRERHYGCRPPTLR